MQKANRLQKANGIRVFVASQRNLEEPNRNDRFRRRLCGVP